MCSGGLFDSCPCDRVPTWRSNVNNRRSGWQLGRIGTARCLMAFSWVFKAVLANTSSLPYQRKGHFSERLSYRGLLRLA